GSLLHSLPVGEPLPPRQASSKATPVCDTEPPSLGSVFQCMKGYRIKRRVKRRNKRRVIENDIENQSASPFITRSPIQVPLSIASDVDEKLLLRRL
ncbi:hypothetical protein AVEN_149941-1, partial [Araneus ventricosus]